VARNPQIEAILNAWYELENCVPSEKGVAHLRLNGLLDAAIGDTQFSRGQILDHLFSQFKEFKVQKRKAAKVQVAQASGAKPV
jgi:hypothetical protein